MAVTNPDGALSPHQTWANPVGYSFQPAASDEDRQGARHDVSTQREDRTSGCRAVLPAWRETDWFSDRERAALAWTEAVTTLEHREVPDDVFA